MQPLLIRAALLCCVALPAWADATISTLQPATIPLPANTCIPALQNGVDASICPTPSVGFAPYFGINTTGLAITDTQPSDPITGTSSATGVMMGLAAAITPKGTGTVVMTVTGVSINATANNINNIRIRYGTGSAPANAAALTGTTCGANMSTSGNSATAQAPFTAQCLVTGLTLNTAVWVDVSLQSPSATLATIKQVEVVLEER